MERTGKIFAGIFILLILSFTFGCATTGPPNVKPNSWLSKGSSTSFEHTDQNEIRKRNLDDIKKILDTCPVMTEAEFLELVGSKNIERNDIIQTLKIVFPHQGITVDMVGKGIQKCIKDKKLFYSYSVYQDDSREDDVGNFIKNKMKFRKTKINEDNKRVLLVFINEDKMLVHNELNTINRLWVTDKTNPLGIFDIDNFGDAIIKQIIDEAVKRAFDEYWP